MLRGFENLDSIVDKTNNRYLNEPGQYVLEIDVMKHKDGSDNPSKPNAAYVIAECSIVESDNDNFRKGAKVSICYDIMRNQYNRRDALRFIASASGESQITKHVKDMEFLSYVFGPEQPLSGKQVKASVYYKDGMDNFAISEFSPVSE